jgi:hypothetical protein
MNKKFVVIAVILISLEGCIAPSYQTTERIIPAQQEPVITAPAITSPAPVPSIATPAPVMTEKSDLLIDRISENLTSFYDRKWNTLYQADELDCSRMSTYFWDYIRRNFHVAPKIIISYERQHAWLALKVSGVGNSTDYSHWNIKGTDYYFVEATIPKVVAEDKQRFLINDREYSSAQFYNAVIYVMDSPREANDFHAEKSSLGGWNQEFIIKYNDMEKIKRLLK